jgi:hypothetical protein
MTMESDPRYAGKPLLRLLECYVLRAIGALPEKEAQTLSDMTPKLREVYAHSGQWPEIIAATVNLPPQAGDAIKGMWDRNQQLAAENNITLSAQEFAEMFVDDNFAA